MTDDTEMSREKDDSARVQSDRICHFSAQVHPYQPHPYCHPRIPKWWTPPKIGSAPGFLSRHTGVIRAPGALFGFIRAHRVYPGIFAHTGLLRRDLINEKANQKTIHPGTP